MCFELFCDNYVDMQNLATLGFDNFQIQENEKSLSEKEKNGLEFFYLRATCF